MRINSAKELIVYPKAFELGKLAYALSLRFPREEVHALTGQLRRSSRSICLNLREAWAKRRYPSKLTDCDGECNETDTALDFALCHGYITKDEHHCATNLCCEVGRMLGAMIQNPEPFLIPESR